MNNRAHIGQNEFEKINWLPVNDRFKQIISSMSFKFCNNTSPPYMNDVFKPAGQPNTTTRASLLKLNQPLRRTYHDQNIISIISPIIWNNLPNSLKTTENLNTYKHRVKEHFFNRIRNEANNILLLLIFLHFNAQPLFIFLVIIIFIISTLLLL